MSGRPGGGLGRGLGALIPTASDRSGGARYAEVPVGAVRPNPQQPRREFEATAMAELVTSIREVGLLQPVVVRETDPGSYELVMGERRWRAAREAGRETLPVIVRDTADADLLRDALLENLHRADLNPLEEAAAYQQLLGDFGATHEQLAARIGRSRPQISNTIRLLQLPAPVQSRLAAGSLSAGHARAILGLPDAALQEELATRVVEQGLSVRATEQAVALASADAPEPRPRARHRRQPAPELVRVAAELSDRLATPVTVDMGRAKGTVTIEFASLADLDRIVTAMTPPA